MTHTVPGTLTIKITLRKIAILLIQVGSTSQLKYGSSLQQYPRATSLSTHRYSPCPTSSGPWTSIRSQHQRAMFWQGWNYGASEDTWTWRSRWLRWGSTLLSCWWTSPSGSRMTTRRPRRSQGSFCPWLFLIFQLGRDFYIPCRNH